MACFVVSVTEAIITTAVKKAVQSKEKETEVTVETEGKIPFSRKLTWLTNLLWGGSILLAFEHVWHGEVVPWFPFLTAASNPADTAEMLHEMATVGTSMALLITCVWGVMVLVTSIMEKKAAKPQTSAVRG